MKSFRRIAIAAMLAVVPMVAAGTAWANSELQPASRLVAPYWDISGDRTTLLFLTNVSRRANLQPTADIGQLNGTCNIAGGGVTGVPGTNCGVHLEFYDKTCDNVNLVIPLSRQDIDQLDLSVDSDLGGVRGLPSKLGWVDIDVRRAITGSGHSNTSVRANVLLGTVIITDAGSDFAIAYPMASSIGSTDFPTPITTNSRLDIVTRDAQGDADLWTGTFETFPARVYVPMFFAEGANYTQTFSSTLAIAGPAQSIRFGEAPGQDLEDDLSTGFIDEGILIDAEVDVVDACENAQSDDLVEHYVFGTLDERFINQVTAPYGTTGNIGTCGYPSRDLDRAPAATAFQGGYIDISNNALSSSWALGNRFTFLDFERGLVGVLVQQTTSRGDATRLWGDCSYGTNGLGSIADGPGGDLGDGGSYCRPDYSLVEDVSHSDILP